jgi:peptidyl-prolyl cis-trans isomerase C
MFTKKTGKTFWLIIAAILAGFVPNVQAAGEKAGVLAVVNGVEVSVGDFYSELNRVQRTYLSTGKPLTAAQVTRLRTEVAEGLVRRELLYQEAKKKVKVSDGEINEELKKVKARYVTETDFNNALNKMKITPESLRMQVERGLVTQKYINTEFSSKSVITDQEVLGYYDRNKNSLRRPEQVRVSHILVKTDPQWDATKKDEARKKLSTIRIKIQNGQSFETFAKSSSEDTTSASKGGDVGYISKGQILKPLEDAVNTLKVGEISDVVETRLGFHLIKATDRKPETILPFADVKNRLEELLKRERGRKEAIAYLAKIREKARVEIFMPPED